MRSRGRVQRRLRLRAAQAFLQQALPVPEDVQEPLPRVHVPEEQLPHEGVPLLRRRPRVRPGSVPEVRVRES
jgi:hypothetical protein